MFSCTMSLHFWENVTYIEVSHVRSWIFGRGWESYHYISYLDADAVLSGASNCEPSDLCSLKRYVVPYFVLLLKSWYLMDWVLGTYTMNGKLYQSLIFPEQCLWINWTRYFRELRRNHGQEKWRACSLHVRVWINNIKVVHIIYANHHTGCNTHAYQ